MEPNTYLEYQNFCRLGSVLSCLTLDTYWQPRYPIIVLLRYSFIYSYSINFGPDWVQNIRVSNLTFGSGMSSWIFSMMACGAQTAIVSPKNNGLLVALCSLYPTDTWGFLSFDYAYLWNIRNTSDTGNRWLFQNRQEEEKIRQWGQLPLALWFGLCNPQAISLCIMVTFSLTISRGSICTSI